MARLTGLEPATPGVTGRYSNQLSYNRATDVPILVTIRQVNPKTCISGSAIGRDLGAARQAQANGY